MAITYVYRDCGDNLHATTKKHWAEEAAVGPIVETDLACGKGYLLTSDGRTIHSDDGPEGPVYLGGNRKKGTPLEECSPEIQAEVRAILDEVWI